MNNLTIALIGHIDHGKTAFIRAMNNYDGDMRRDEKERGMTIDVSFSNVVLGKNHISFIDVPGHEKLIKNMISGAFSVDMLALVVASDDGIMPQTLEHLHIAQMLGLEHIVVFITKSDLAESSVISKIEREIRELLENLNFKILHIAPFSVYDEAQISDAKLSLANIKIPKRNNGKFFRYYCDRCFSKKGIGTIVTGTILGGEVKKNDKVFACELGKEGIVRQIHHHDCEVESALPSERIAFNINIDGLKKGMLLSKKGILRGFDRLDVVIFPLGEIVNMQEMTFFIGAKKLGAKIHILEHNERGIYASLQLSEAVFAVFKERFILRDNAMTKGGGIVLNPIADPMKKAQKIQYLRFLHSDDFTNAFGILLNAHKRGFGLLQSLQRFDMTYQEALEVARGLKNVFIDEESFVLYGLEVKAQVKESILSLVAKNHNAIFSANSISNSLKWSSPRLTQAVLDELSESGAITKRSETLYLSAESSIDDIASYTQDMIMRELTNGGITPEAPYNIYDKLDIDREAGDKALKTLTKNRKVVRLSHNLFVLTTTLTAIMEHLRDIIKKQGYIDISVFKSHYNISRKYIISYLDYLDSYGDIIKQDNKRFLK